MKRTLNFTQLRALRARLARWSMLGRIALAFGCVTLTLSDLDRLYPLPSLERRYSTVVTAADGTPLRAFPDDDGVWRYPVALDQVSPLYLEALLGYEDRWFYYHPGINPFALARAAWQWARHGAVVSGGSTLSMQVARLIDPQPRTAGGKVWQMLRALQLEWHLTKEEILTLYLNLAPYGGPVEGVQAAAFAYLGKPAKTLTHAEAALLAVLPQAPSRLRPDRHPHTAQAARDKVLARLATHGIWSAAAVRDARLEPVAARALAPPLLAPLLAERLRAQSPHARRIATTIDYELQCSLEQMLRARLTQLPARTSVAVLVAENRNLAVRAYLGSGDMLDNSRYGYIDMVRATRSPGSTLKPFIYGAALDDGLIHSESLLADVPTSFAGYEPDNFEDGFSGPVSARETLQRSLNIPAVDLLERLGPERFAAWLRHGGVHLALPGDEKPNLAMALGGTGTSLEDLVAGYSAFARGGLSGALRFSETEALRERRMLSEGAAFIVRWMLATNPRPGLSSDVDIPPARQVAWKTGTSYGFRDAWALGVTDRYTIGVWVGRPDGTPLPGHYGAVTAAPILFDIVDSLPTGKLWSNGLTPPRSATQASICWPLGLPPEPGREYLCHERRTAWLLNGATPPTLPDRWRNGGGIARYWVNSDTGLRVEATCKAKRREPREQALWPVALEPWLAPPRRAHAHLPAFDRSCPKKIIAASTGGLKIVGVRPHSVLRPAGAGAGPPVVTLSALGAEPPLVWLINGYMIGATHGRRGLRHIFSAPGTYDITALDSAGNYDRLSIKVTR